MKNKVASVILSAIFISALSFSAFANPNLDMKLDSQKVVIENKKEKFISAKTVSPGDIVLYTLNVVNKGTSPALKFEPVGNIPPNTVYVQEKNNSKDYKILFSIDKGQTFQEVPMVRVVEKGKPILKKAPIEMYNKIKWSFSKNLKPNEKVSLNYRVLVK